MTLLRKLLEVQVKTDLGELPWKRPEIPDLLPIKPPFNR